MQIFNNLPNNNVEEAINELKETYFQKKKTTTKIIIKLTDTSQPKIVIMVPKLVAIALPPLKLINAEKQWPSIGAITMRNSKR